MVNDYRETPFVSEEDGIRYLHFASAYLQGAMRIRKPTELVWQYTQEMMSCLLFHEPSETSRIGILGLGAGSLVRFCLRHTRAMIDVVEYNPAVTELCIESFMLPATDERLNYIHDDAKHYMKQEKNKYDILLVDLYDHQAKGPSCSSKLFYKSCYESLKPSGVMSVNLFANHSSFEKNLHRIHDSFKQQCFALPETPDGNCIVVAGKNMKFSKSRALAIEKEWHFPARKWLNELRDSHLSQAVTID
ncbi:spermine/spermidine synthase domain-containing protein [Basilea psittacipulmonis]|uniref:PABS domain-containing protein n=1 Tax=Basilea psittacipulmonis DSM 24701 TaxID=1072685 RepID=A0A077DI45_9BURK|nr:hypothetical protein [Basilea psittacipulmonis]AIL32813.1 hypothetical protein IX83_05335 [Basilea psittacipulmonis DSM 24701]